MLLDRQKGDSNMSSSADRAAQKRQELEDRIELRTIHVPADDKRILEALAKLRQVPASTADKRIEQLKRCLLDRKRKNMPFTMEEVLALQDEDANDEEYWSVGQKELLTLRRQLAHQSLNNSRSRLNKLFALSKIPIESLKEQQHAFSQTVQNLQPIASYPVSQRPLTSISSSKTNPSMIAVGDMGGQLKLHQLQDEELAMLYQSTEHKGRIGDIQWHPTASLDDDVAHFATTGQDGQILFYNCTSDDPFSDIQAHEQRCNRLRFLSASHFLSCGFDHLIKLWDYEQQTCVLEQPGHEHGVYDISVHPDLSLMFSGDLDGKGRLWDLRTGRSLYLFQELKGILASTFHPNGFWLSTAGEQGTVKLYDVRQLQQFYEIPAHTQNVTGLQWCRNTLETNALISCSFDQTVKIWSENDWTLLLEEPAHDGKITCMDWSAGRLLTGA